MGLLHRSATDWPELYGVVQRPTVYGGSSPSVLGGNNPRFGLSLPINHGLVQFTTVYGR